MPELNPGIAQIPMPDGVKRLPIGPNGFPVPWFVAWIDGKPEFRVADGAKFENAVRERRCWTCGERLDNRCTYVVGSMCVVNLVTAEPPNHPACAEYSVRACPFLSRPGMVRREGGLPEEAKSSGEMIRRNPGVSCLWTGRTPGSVPFKDGQGGILFRLNPATVISWWAEGRQATPEEVEQSVTSGLPLLYDMARQQGPDATLSLDRMVADAAPLFPVH